MLFLQPTGTAGPLLLISQTTGETKRVFSLSSSLDLLVRQESAIVQNCHYTESRPKFFPMLWDYERGTPFIGADLTVIEGTLDVRSELLLVSALL